uniref:C6 domain-containing protein n=1 Tax=Acrobeloides nanus TaxID=290746 RepID=A0A914EKX0_9BILA
MDGTEAISCCLNGVCGAGYVCSLGNLCCRRGDGTGNDLFGANNGFGTGNGGISGVTTSTASTTLFTTATSATTATMTTTTTTVNPLNCNGCDSRNINVNPSQGGGVSAGMLQPGNQNGCQTTTVTCHCQGQNTMCSIEVNNDPASVVTVGPPCDVTLTLTCSNGQWISQFGAVTSITCVGIIDEKWI